MTTQRLTRIALLAATCVVLRYAFAPFPNVKPITALFLLVTAQLGLLDGLLVMALTMTTTALFLGFGPWVAFQLATYGLLLIFWRFLAYPLTNALKSARIKQVAQASLAGLVGLVYGFVIDGLWALAFGWPVWLQLVRGLSFNLAHALSTALFYPLLAVSLVPVWGILKKGE